MDFLDCKICHNPYDEQDYRPRSAPCGHELCTSCIKGLIKDSTLLCPKCRKVSKVEVPDDLPINFGLIDVMRALKTMHISSTKESESIPSGATNDELCSIHYKAISHWCFKCRIMICDECLEDHSSMIGCSTEDIKSMKNKHIENANKLLNVHEKDVNYVYTIIQEHTKLAEKHLEESTKLKRVLEQGKAHKNKLVDSKTHLNLENSPHGVIDRIEELTRWEQSLKSWSVTNLGTETPKGLSKLLAEKKDVFTEMDYGFGKRYAQITQQNDGIYFHTFHLQDVEEDSIIMPFDRFQKMIPPHPSLVFMEFSLERIVMGGVFLRLRNDLPNIRENMITIVTGQKGQSFLELTFDEVCEGDINIETDLPFMEIPVTVDDYWIPAESSKTQLTVFSGDVIGYYGEGYLQYIYFYVDTKPNSQRFGEDFYVVGKIEKGMDILTECYNRFEEGCVMISDCGLVIEPENWHF